MLIRSPQPAGSLGRPALRRQPPPRDGVCGPAVDVPDDASEQDRLLGRALAIDRQEMVRLLYGGNATIGNPGFIPDTHPFHVDGEQYGHDPDVANRMLDQAGYERSGSGGTAPAPRRRGVELGATA